MVETTSDVAAIVPTTTLQEVLRVTSDDIDEVELLFDETQVRFRIGDTEITSRLIDGNFPDYRQIIPGDSEVSATIDKSEFIRVTKIAGLFAREAGGSVTVTLSDESDSVSVHSIASELGENTSEAGAKVSGDGQITLNSRYLGEALGVTPGDDVVFRFSGKLSPCVLTEDSDDIDYRHVIMPLKS